MALINLKVDFGNMCDEDFIYIYIYIYIIYIYIYI